MSLRRPELHAKASRIARAASARFGADPPADLRQVLSYWLASEIAFERAAQQLVTYAAALGITERAVNQEEL